MESWTNLISNLGFPIVISIYLLVRIEQKISCLTASLQDLTQAIARLQENLDR